MKVCRKNKGVIIVLVAGILVPVILLFLVVGGDFAYMYYVRGELQNAADSAALAGAAKLDGTNSVDQPKARNEAVIFAAKNNAAKSPVILASDSSNTLTDNNDITVGNWDPTLPPNERYLAGRTPINAVQVVARRTANSPGGPVGLLFGKLVKWPFMSVKRQAIARKNPGGFTPLPICIDTCQNLPETPLSGTPPGLLLKLSTPSSAEEMAWTDFQPVGSGPDFWKNIQDLLGVDKVGGKWVVIEPVPVPDKCESNECLRTTNGVGSILPAITAIIEARGATYTIKGIPVFGWRTYTPVFDPCLPSGPNPCPGDQPAGYKWVQATEVIVTGVIETGPDAGLYVVGLDESNPDPTKSKLSCISCSDQSLKELRRVKLVK
jgi:Flp pilus assembly protein TadG